MLPGQRQSALREDLVGALGGVLHGDDHPIATPDQVHGPTHATHHFARDLPVGQVPVGSNLQPTQHGHLHVPTTNHGERLRAIKIRRPGQLGDRSLTSVNQIGVNLIFVGVRPDAEHAVLTVEDDAHARGNVVGGDCRNADPQVDVSAVRELQRSAASNPLSLDALGSGPRNFDSMPIVNEQLLNALLESSLEYPLHVNGRHMHLVCGDGPCWDDFFDLSNGNPCGTSQRLVEVVRGGVEHQVAQLICLPCLHKAEVATD
mmetsp:Transcript_45855/g.99644  ORF Transcript_45855/g.99644 Transcript_45855/m.99644 type:complete len:260 (-) Transcript_45855:610-1389(-)